MRIRSLAVALVAMYRMQAPRGFDPRNEEPQAAVLDLNTLPEDIRKEPSLGSIKTIPDLAKSYVSAQKLIGTKRLPVPDQSWNESQWNEFYDAVGRPKTADDYQFPDVKLEGGMKIDDTKAKALKQTFHKLGLTPNQSKGVMEYYFNTLNETSRSTTVNMEKQNAEAMAALKGEWSEKYDANIDMAKQVISKFGDEQFGQYLESGMGSNVPLIKLLAKIGATMVEDPGRSGSGGFNVKDSTKAIAEIDNLRTDKDFMVALLAKENVGHRAAVERWTKLHAVAYPGKETE
jgi:hypothetical protein